ncbi:hypothetical protein [Cupriavidus sp. UME77]|uniref:hypothetical protein n=1 Tax=Cupriavidus sp. UME77 TaxID=1862321 RepID=UPI001D8A8DCA|nr:hypothetical protein [Cupriavidus sp. UME77]MBB1630817.1 hypothetical protein [Cupriavidus sp. UME77]
MATDAVRPWQRLQRRRQRGLGLWPALWLALCLLLAQHAGLTHRIHHGGLLSLPLQAAASHGAAALPVTAAAADDDDDDEIQVTDSARANPDLPFSLKLAGHFCVLFDGATVAASHCGTPVVPALTHLQSPVPFSVGWRRPDLQHPQPFRSRAPPAVHALA